MLAKRLRCFKRTRALILFEEAPRVKAHLIIYVMFLFAVLLFNTSKHGYWQANSTLIEIEPVYVCGI